MKTENFLDPKRLAELQKPIWKIAKEHGWHEESKPVETWLGLVMSEVAEAVEADRNCKRAYSDEFKKLLGPNNETSLQLAPGVYRSNFDALYKNHIKGSIEEEFADVVIRLIDMAEELYGEQMLWLDCYCYPYCTVFNDEKSFIGNSWIFVKEVLNCGMVNISDSVSFMFDWAQHLDIDLWQHIEWKMRYNELRPYKHGGKKY